MGMTSVRAGSRLGHVRWPLAEWALLSCLLGCGRASLVVGSGAGTGGGNGGMAAPADGGGGSLGGSLGGGGGGALGGGGASASGGAAGTVPFMPVDPQVSRQWRWRPCGSIPPLVGDAAQVIFPPAGNALAVLYDDGIVMLYPRDDGAAPKLLRSAGGGPPPASIAFSLDGAWLAEVAAGVVRMRDVATGTMIRDMKANSACTGTTVRFSAEGDHVLAWDQTSLCVWQTADGAFVTRLTGTFSSAGMRQGRILTVEPGPPGTSVKSWSLSGGDHSEIALETQPAGFESIFVSPRADTLAGITIDADQVCTLWSADGTLVTSFPLPLSGNVAAPTYVGYPVYSESGAVVLFGTEVVDVASLARWTNTAVDSDYPSTIDETGMLIAGINGPFAGRAQSGSPDARRLFGFPYPSPPSPSSDLPTVLSVSPDGSRLAAATAGLAMLWRLAPDFAASVPMRWMSQGVPLEASFSASRGELVVSGDGWSLFSAGEGALLSVPPLFPNVPPTSSCDFNLARFSSDGQWLALGGFGAVVVVLARDGLKPVASLPTASCQERGSFNGDGSLLALSGPELYRTSDWSLVWPAQIIPEPPPTGAIQADIFRDVQFTPGEKTVLVSGCGAGGNLGINCAHAIYSVSDGALVQRLPQLNGTRARFSGEGNWIVSGNTVLHVPTGESVVFDPSATLSTFAPNGDIVAVLGDSSLARYCRIP